MNHSEFVIIVQTHKSLVKLLNADLRGSHYFVKLDELDKVIISRVGAQNTS